MVNLTQPVDLCFTKPENKGDKVYQSYALEILSHQQSYKEAFGDEEFMACLASKLKKLLEKVNMSLLFLFNVFGDLGCRYGHFTHFSQPPQRD